MRYRETLIGISKYCIDGITKQGGWGAEVGYYNETNPLNTAEVLCGLILSRRYLYDVFLSNEYDNSIAQGIEYLMSTQLETGGWATGSAYLNKTNKHIGNIISTSWSTWAISEYLSLHSFDSDLRTNLLSAIKLSIRYISMSKKSVLWCYNPTLETPVIMPSSYAYLALGAILKNKKITNFLEVEYLLTLKNLIMESIDSVIKNFKLNSEKCSLSLLTMSACIYYIALQFLADSDCLVILHDKIKDAQDFFFDFITKQNGALLSNAFTETQTIIESDNKARDFIHYLPLWVLIVFSYNHNQVDSISFTTIKEAVLGNIHDKYHGASYDRHSKRFAWTSGLTLMAISLLKNNIDVVCGRSCYSKEIAVENSDPNQVFVAFGRNLKIQKSLFAFLRACGLTPIEWESAVRESSKGSPHITDILGAAFKRAQAIIILLTGDEKVELVKYLKNANDINESYSYQSRPNVIFEAGLAYAQNPTRTIFVQVGRHRTFSDIEGIHILKFSGTSNDRHALRTRLHTAGCKLNDDQSWLTEGDFTIKEK